MNNWPFSSIIVDWIWPGKLETDNLINFWALRPTWPWLNPNSDPGGLTQPQKWVQFGVIIQIVRLNPNLDLCTVLVIPTQYFTPRAHPKPGGGLKPPSPPPCFQQPWVVWSMYLVPIVVLGVAVNHCSAAAGKLPQIFLVSFEPKYENGLNQKNEGTLLY